MPYVVTSDLSAQPKIIRVPYGSVVFNKLLNMNGGAETTESDSHLVNAEHPQIVHPEHELQGLSSSGSDQDQSKLCFHGQISIWLARTGRTRFAARVRGKSSTSFHFADASISRLPGFA